MATARSAYAEMLPAGMEAELFALFGEFFELTREFPSHC